MVARKGLLAPQNTFLDTIAARFDGTRKLTTNQPMPGLLLCLLSLPTPPDINSVQNLALFINVTCNWTWESVPSLLRLTEALTFVLFYP